MRNVIIGDNQNIGKIDQSFHLLGSEISSNFQRFAAEHIGILTQNQQQAYTDVFTEIVEQERIKLQRIYSPYNLMDNRRMQFQSLFENIKIGLLDELQHVRKAVNSVSESQPCWTDNKPVICKMIEGVAVKIDEILKLAARRLQRDIDSITDVIERSGQIVQSAHERCVHENYARTKQCVAYGVSDVKTFFSFFIIFPFHF